MASKVLKVSTKPLFSDIIAEEEHSSPILEIIEDQMPLRKPIVFETPFTQYTGTDIIGEGGAGRVYKATSDDNNAYAIKLLDSKKATRQNMKRFKNEVDFCSRNRHPN